MCERTDANSHSSCFHLVVVFEQFAPVRFFGNDHQCNALADVMRDNRVADTSYKVLRVRLFFLEHHVFRGNFPMARICPASPKNKTIGEFLFMGR